MTKDEKSNSLTADQNTDQTEPEQKTDQQVKIRQQV